MRFRVSCSAALVLVLTACGGAHRSAGPFAYDASAPLAVRAEGVYATAPRAAVRALSFRGAGSTRVEAYLVVPRAPGRHPAVLFLHGSGGTRSDLIGPAAKLALRGVVTLTITEPAAAETYRPLVVDARRALDLLDARHDVDASRLGVVGFSLGGQIAAILAGADPRPVAVGVIAGRGTDVARYWIRRSRARLYFQAGTEDEVVPHAQLLALMHAAPGTPKISWYTIGHTLTAELLDDQLRWQAARLGLR